MFAHTFHLSTASHSPFKQHVRPTLPPLFNYAHISFARCVRPCFITNPRYLNTQLSRFLHKSIPYMTRAYARERKTITFPHHGLHRTKAIPLPHSPIRINTIRVRFGLLPRLAKQTSLRKQVSQQPGIKRTTPTNHPAPSGPEKAAKALFTTHLEQKRREKIWNY